MMQSLLVFVISVASIKTLHGSNGVMYPSSLSTLNEVPNCPRNQHDWEKAAARKDCNQISKSDNKPFVYHCLINEWANATVEVCAPTWFVSGFCAMYSSSDARVIDNFNYDCTHYTPPCPQRYISSEAYKYGVCYDIARPTTTQFTTQINVTQKSLTESTTGTTTEVEHSTTTIRLTSDGLTTTHLILVTVIPTAFLIVLLVRLSLLCLIIMRKRRAGKENEVLDKVEREPLDRTLTGGVGSINIGENKEISSTS